MAGKKTKLVEAYGPVKIEISLKDGTCHEFRSIKELHVIEDGMMVVDKQDVIWCYPINSISYWKYEKEGKNVQSRRKQQDAEKS